MRVKVWDWPTRLCHWLLAVAVPFSYWAAKTDHLPWHRLSGYAILGGLIFRLIWGFAGSSASRFSSFLRGPRAVAAYLRGGAAPGLGHNPAGGWSVAAMLLALATQVGLGLFAVDEDGLEGGPLSKFISFDAGRAIAHLHHLVFWGVLALIGLHLAAIAFYAARGRNLVGPMVTGLAEAPGDDAPPPLAPGWRIAAAAIMAAAMAWFIAHGLRL